MRVKSSGMAPGWQMPGPRAVQNLQNKLMPHPRDGQGGQMPRSSPGAGGGGAGRRWNGLMHYLRAQIGVRLISCLRIRSQPFSQRRIFYPKFA